MRGKIIMGLGIIIALSAFITCDYYDSKVSTYIEPVFPPSGEYYFTIEDNWTAQNAMLAGIAIVVGIAMAFFGYRFIYKTLYIVAFVSAYGVGYIYLQYFLAAYISPWLNLLLALPPALLVTWLASCLVMANIALVGVLSAFILVIVFWSGCIGQFNQSLPTWFVITQWGLAVVGGGVGGVVVVAYQRVGLIIGTSFIGSFLAAVGGDYFLQDHFAYLLIQFFTNQPALFHPVWLAVVAIIYWLTLFVISALVQWFVTADDFDHRGVVAQVIDEEKDFVKFIHY